MCLLDAAVSPCSNAPRSMKLERCPDRLHQLCQPLGATRALIFRCYFLILKPNCFFSGCSGDVLTVIKSHIWGVGGRCIPCTRLNANTLKDNREEPRRNKDKPRCCSMPYLHAFFPSCLHYSRVGTFSLLFTSLPLPSQSEWESRLLGYDRVARLSCSWNPDHEYHIRCVVLLNCFIAQRT